jgi:hypothetical protein
VYTTEFPRRYDTSFVAISEDNEDGFWRQDGTYTTLVNELGHLKLEFRLQLHIPEMVVNSIYQQWA